MSSGKYSMAKAAEEDGTMATAYRHDSNGSAVLKDSPPPYNEVEGQSKVNGKENGVAPNADEVEVKDGKEKTPPQPMVGMLEVFRFADLKSRILLAIGIIASCLHGACLPLMIIVFGEMTDTFVSDGRFKQFWDSFGPNITDIYNVTQEEFLEQPDLQKEVFARLNMTDEYDQLINDAVTGFLEQMNKNTIYYVILGCVVIVVGYCQLSCMMTSAFRQSQTVRTSLFRAILRQDIGWFDTHEIGELNTRLADDVNKIQEGIGDKLGQFFQYFCMFLAGIIVGLVKGWKLTLVILAVSPLLAVSGGFMSKLGSAFTSKELKAYAKAGAVAEEVLSSIRTVFAFGGQEKEAIRYADNLVEAKSFGIRKGVTNGTSMGVVFFIIFGSYALAFWYGTQLVMAGEYTGGEVLIVFFSVMIGAFSIGNTTTNFQYFATARGAAHAVYNVIDLVPTIDSASEAGTKPAEIVGNIEFSDVKFAYPSRPDVVVLDSMNLKVNVGQTVALVGSSGCGKSTTIQLLQRFYDTHEGSVKVDGVDVRELNVQWLRRHIGVVSQEPILFATTIAENIRYGREDVTDQEIQQAATMANAHDFISKLPKKYETLVGERGAQLSGGQKQRIAIARALVRNPKILLLDEATSALDTESESVVQAALDKAREGRTTIVIAHRLSTIRTANVIAGFRDGRVVEQGTHDELMAKEGIYYTLVTTQTHGMELEDDNLEDPLDVARQRKLSRAMSSGSGGRPDSGKALERTMSLVSKTGSQEEEEEDLPEPSMGRIMKMNAPEWPYIVLGAISSIINGGVQPAFAIIFANIIGVFSEIDQEKQEKDALLYSMLFLAIGAVQGICMFLMSFMFSYSGETLTMRLRDLVFRTLLRQEVAYFDDHKNNTGALTTRLATEASAVQGATGSRIGSALQGLSSITAGMIIGFVYSWKLALLLTGFAPFMMIAGYVQMNVMTGNAKTNKEALENAGKTATEAIVNIRTVAQLTKEHRFYSEYKKMTEIPYKKNLKNAHISGLAFGISQALVFFAYAACFRFGAFLIETDGLAFDDMFRVVSAILFSAMAVGQASSFAPDYGKAKSSAARIFQLIDRVPPIDSGSTEGEKPGSVTGDLEFKAVAFNYPTRPDVPVLRGLDLSVKNGKTLALVGSSGCGKSTSVQLLERYYDTIEGQVTLDNRDVRNLNISWLRSQIGLVQQEPILFDCSIRENIEYGDNSRDVPMDEIIAAAKDANIHSFIASLPQGYETNVGDKGTQLSGGQKQRIAIARALVRNPRILLLDEATSALDTESEKIVQDALDRAQQGRTCVVIAHRLSTIHDADAIAVIHNGTVIELGTHNELMALQGRYYKLNSTQARKQ